MNGISEITSNNAGSARLKTGYFAEGYKR